MRDDGSAFSAAMIRSRAFFISIVAALSACSRATPRSAAAASESSTSAHASIALTYLGVAGWELDDDAHALLVDPYFSRPNARNSSNLLVPDEATISRFAPKSADLILVTHSHYDHVLDVATIAKRAHASVAGTESTINLARAEGVAESNLILARPHDAFARGGFAVRVFESLHSLTGQTNAEIPRDVHLPMSSDGYGEGGTLQYLVTAEGHSVFFVGTANFVESELRELHPDVAVIAVGLREKIPDYTCRLMRALGNPPLVLANHFDAFWKHVDDDTAPDPDTRADLAKFADEVHACSPLTRVVVPAHFQRIDL